MTKKVRKYREEKDQKLKAASRRGEKRQTGEAMGSKRQIDTDKCSDRDTPPQKKETGKDGTDSDAQVSGRGDDQAQAAKRMAA